MIFPGPPITIGVASGSKLRYLAVNANGEAEVELEKSAYAEETGLSVYAISNAQGFSVDIADRAVEIMPWVNPTFKKFSDPQQGILRVENVNLDPTEKQMDVGILPSNWNDPEQWWYVYPNPSTLTAGAWGAWNFQPPSNPTALWDTGETTFTSYRDYYYTYDQVLALVTGPETKTATLTVTDHVDSVTRSANLTIRLHSLCENITETSDERVYSGWKRVSNEEIMYPGDEERWLERSNGVVASVTKKVMNDWGGEAGVTIQGILQVKVAGKRQWGQDETAQLSNTIATRYRLEADSVPMMHWIERNAFWRKKWGWADVYLSDGFAGIVVWNYEYWESATKELAELQDFQQKKVSIEYEEPQ